MHDIIQYTPIGVIRSPHKVPSGTPIQPAAAHGIEGTVEVLPKYAKGLQDLDGFSHIILVYHFHLARSYALTVTPFMDDQPRGIFAVRAPVRPNPIGLSVVQLTSVAWNILHVQNVDIVDGTPLLDIKPYVPQFDAQDAQRIGWLTEKIDGLSRVRDDSRFAESPA